MSQRYLVDFKTRSLAVYNSEFILDNACIGLGVIK